MLECSAANTIRNRFLAVQQAVVWQQAVAADGLLRRCFQSFVLGRLISPGKPVRMHCALFC